MWTYTTYILWKYVKKYPDKEVELKFSEFADFIFKFLWRQNQLIFHDGIQDLYLDLKYLKKLGIIEFDDNEKLENIKIKVKDKDKLVQIVKVVEESATLTGVQLLGEYVQRIDAAIERISVAT